MIATDTSTTRDFLRNFAKFKRKRKPTIIMNRDKAEGVFVPYPQWNKIQDTKKQKARVTSFADLAPFRFRGPKDLSQTIDDIYQ